MMRLPSRGANLEATTFPDEAHEYDFGLSQFVESIDPWTKDHRVGISNRCLTMVMLSFQTGWISNNGHECCLAWKLVEAHLVPIPPVTDDGSSNCEPARDSQAVL